MAKVVIYTKNYCSFCHWATALLKNRGVEFEEIDITRDPALQQEVQRLSGQRTVPQIFIDAHSVGGFMDLKGLDAAGELDRLLGLKE
jgi:glutaredoxin 3